MPQFVYQPKSCKQLRGWFSQKKSKGVNGFINFDDFHNWFKNQEPVCHYCGLKEIESQELVMKGILKSNRFPQNGIHGPGTSRAIWLEVDRLNPKDKYSKDNCVLCCYFCNNDKSDVFDGNEYSKFLNNRAVYLRQILEEHNKRF